jgi:hypothetical protein
MSRRSRASLASSLLLLGVVAAGCGGGEQRDAQDVRAAFSGTQFFTLRVEQLRDELSRVKRPVRPLSSLLAMTRAAAGGSIVLSLRAPTPVALLSARDGSLGAEVFASEGDAARVERAIRDVDTSSVGFGVRRVDNVVVTYRPRLERRVDAALDRLR